MIAPDAAAELKAERRFDLAAAILIGAIAILAAVLAVIQIASGQAAGRAQIQAARLTADLSARLEVSAVAQDSEILMLRVALADATQAQARELAGLQNDDAGAVAVGQAQVEAAQDLNAALTSTSDTIGPAPGDPYVSGLLEATIARSRGRGCRTEPPGGPGQRSRQSKHQVGPGALVPGARRSPDGPCRRSARGSRGVDRTAVRRRNDPCGERHGRCGGDLSHERYTRRGDVAEARQHGRPGRF